MHSSTCAGCFSQVLLHRGAWQVEQRCHVFSKGAEQPRQIGLDCSRLGPTTAAFSLRMMSPGDMFLVATMYLNGGIIRSAYLGSNKTLPSNFFILLDSVGLHTVWFMPRPVWLLALSPTVSYREAARAAGQSLALADLARSCNSHTQWISGTRLILTLCNQ